MIARWTCPDPLAEISRRWSTFNYGEDNPIKNIDPDGMEIFDTADGITYTGKDIYLEFKRVEQQIAHNQKK